MIDRVTKVLKSEVSKIRSRNGFTNLYTNLNKNELIEELDDRGIHWKSSDNASKMLQKLKTEMHGIQRVPSLHFNCPEGDIDLMYLGNYEILACEPLHDIENHIKNLFVIINLFSLRHKLHVHMINTIYIFKTLQ